MGQEQKIRLDRIQTGDEGTGGFFNKLKVWEDHFDKVKKVVDSMQPAKVDTAATTYGAVAKRMDDSVGLIYNQATRMVEAWGGKDAEKAMDQMNKAYRQAQEIQTKSSTTSQALAAHAKSQRGWQQAYGSGSAMDSWVKDAVNWGERALALNPTTAPAAIGSLIGNNYGAEDAMNAINNGTVDSNNNFPRGIVQDMPQADPRLGETDPITPPGTGKPPGSPKMPGGPGSPGGPGDVPGGPGGPDLPSGPGGPGGPGDIPGGPPGGPGSDIPGGPNGPGLPGGPGGPDLPGGPGGPGGGIPGTDLASLPPGGGPGGGPGLGGGGMPGGGPGLGGGGLGGGPGAGPGGLGGGLGAGPGAFGAGPGAFGKNALAGKGGMAGMGMPMGGAGARGGGDGNEHERSTWLTEDEDVWGGDDDTAPPVIG
ncbi:WXG100 family type VII secretion target [Actinomadura monticuli]|uniref:PPE domain-containing protein n=1 Tax=Actinomadura monticuli TaxID=3097367 RepID=A0ABV4Q3S4_9ACTN